MPNDYYVEPKLTRFGSLTNVSPIKSKWWGTQ